MKSDWEAVIQDVARRVQLPEKTFIAATDGLLHCSICGNPVQKRIRTLGREFVVPLSCDCIMRKEREFKAREEAERKTRNRQICFGGLAGKYAEARFELSSGYNERIAKAMEKYADDFKNIVSGEREGDGFLLFGPVGTGKSWLCAAVCNRILDNGYTALLTNFGHISDAMGDWAGRKEYMESLLRYSLLVLDDLGIERQSEYMQEIVYNVINSRYEAGLPMLVTTNLTKRDILDNRNINLARIYDRLLQCCIPVEVNGKSIRREEFREKNEKRKGVYGL